MHPDKWERVKSVYHEALGLEPGERAAFLCGSCGDDPEVLNEVESLLAQPGDDSFLERPAWQPAEEGALPPLRGEPAMPPGEAQEIEQDTRPARWHPFLSVVWLALAGSIVAFGYAAWRLPQDDAWFGWSEAQRGGHWEVVSVSSTGPASGQLDPGDVLLGLDGDSNVARIGTSIYRSVMDVGARYRLQVRRGGVTRDVALPVAGVPPDLVYSVFFFILSLAWCAIGLFIGFARPQEKIARLALSAAVLTGFVYLQTTEMRGFYALQPLHVVLGYHFFYLFPGARPRGRGWKFLLWAFYLATAAYVVRSVWLQWLLRVHGPGAATDYLASPTETLMAGLVLAMGLVVMPATVAVAVHKYRSLTDTDARRRFHWVTLGGVVGLAPPALLVVLGSLRANPDVARWLFPGYAWTEFDMVTCGCSVAIPLGVAYVVVKHGVWGVKVAIRRGLQYLLARRALQVLLAVPVSVLLITIIRERHRTVADLVTGGRGAYFWILALALSLRFRAPILKWLDRRFFHEEYDSERLVLDLVDTLNRFDSAEQMAGFLCQELERSLHPKSMHFWWRKSGVMTMAETSDPTLRSTPLPVSESLFERLTSLGKTASVPLPTGSGASGRDARWLAERGVRLIVPVSGTERVDAVLMLGEKQSEEPYTPGDAHLAHAMVQAAALMLDNLRLKGQVIDEQRIRREVLARLDRGLVSLLKECPACGACYDSGAEDCPRDGSALTLTLPVARVIDGKYRLDRLIGRGGMGAVYEARDLRLDREVALKVMLGGAFGHESALRRFRREAQAVARLNHPNIVAVYDFGELEGGGAYLVMERLRGTTLRAEMTRVGVFSPAEAADWFEPMMDGLAAAHEQGVVHRDFKPENVVGVRRGGGTLAVKILDFGLAKIRPLPTAAPNADSVTESGVVLGTLAYMAPEQFRGHEIDARADIYSAGVMLVEMLTHARPLADGANVHADYRLPASVPNRGALDAVLGRCLATSPTDRFSLAADLRAALVPALRAGSATRI